MEKDFLSLCRVLSPPVVAQILHYYLRVRYSEAGVTSLAQDG